jgi:hypothetical protein
MSTYKPTCKADITDPVEAVGPADRHMNHGDRGTVTFRGGLRKSVGDDKWQEVGVQEKTEPLTEGVFD